MVVAVVVVATVVVRMDVIEEGAKHHLQKPYCAVHKERARAGLGTMDVVEIVNVHAYIVGTGIDNFAAADKENIDAGTKAMI